MFSMLGQPAEATADAATVTPSTEDRLDEVLSREGNPQQSNYLAMCDGIQMVTGSKPLARKCEVCDGSGIVPLTEEDIRRRKRKIGNYDEDIERANDPRAWEEAEGRKRRYMSEIVKDDWCRHCNGTGWFYTSASKPLAGMFATDRCGRCRGCGEELGRDPVTKRRSLAPHGSEEFEDICRLCGVETIRDRQQTPMPLNVGSSGPGYWFRCTAQPKGGMKGGNRWSGESLTDNPLNALPYALSPHTEVPDQKQVEYGKVQRIIDQVRQESSVLAAAIEAWHGPGADRWKLHKWGRGFTLWPLTKAGKQLARDGSRGAAYLLDDVDRIASERQAEEASKLPDVRRRALIREADQQARALEGLMRERVARIVL